MGDIIVRRVADTSHVEAAHINVDYSQFVLATAKKENRAGERTKNEPHKAKNYISDGAT